MQSREPRYWLRIESGARQGEKLPLPAGTHDLGRQADNSVVLRDPSVSGRHARLQVGPDGLRITDLGSTNGVRVDGRRIDEQELAHGDRVSLGNVAMVVMDATLDGSATAAVGGLDDAPELELSGPRTARATARPRRGLLVGLLGGAVLVAAGAYAWRELRPREDVQAHAPVARVPGNLLADGSFEEDGGAFAWEPAPRAPQTLARDPAHARSGALGLGAELAAGGWVFGRSPALELRARRALVARAAVRSSGQSQARFGVELSSSDGVPPAFVAWSRPLAASSGFEELALTFDVPPGFDRARAVFAARGAGRVAVDDVSLVQDDAADDPAASFLEYEARLFGEPATRAAVVRGGRVLLSDIGLDAWRAARLEGQPSGTWSVHASDSGLRFDAHGTGDDTVLGFTIVSPAAADEPRAGAVLFATIGPEGYRSHSSTFEVDRATDLVLGGALGPMRVAFGRPVWVRAATVDGAPRVSIGIGDAGGFDLQLRFREERIAALALRATAEEAEEAGDAGRALEAWRELLDEHPFDPALVAKAENARARLVQEGLEAVAEVRRDVEQARFFGLRDLHRRCRERAAEIARGFRGTEVEAEARELLATVEAELAALGSERRDEVARLEAVLSSPTVSRSAALSERVTRALDELEAEAQR